MTPYDLAYAAGLAAGAPYWLLRRNSREKVFAALRERMGRDAPPSQSPQPPTLMLHAVSVGELNATPLLVQRLSEARPALRFVISTTTRTGWERAAELYGDNNRVRRIRFPLDFSSAAKRVLDAFAPRGVVLMELEVWPNFVAECRRRGIPVLIVNGRLTESSFRGYRLLRAITRGMFGSLAQVCAQDAVYAERFRKVGAPPDRVHVTGTMKFDTATLADRVEGDAELAAAVGIETDASPKGGPISPAASTAASTKSQGRLARNDPLLPTHPTPEAPGEGQEARLPMIEVRHVPRDRKPVWVCGSTGPGEEELLLDVYQRLLAQHPGLRLIIVPRKPERFDEVARLIQHAGFSLVRRSRPKPPQQPAGRATPPVVLGDTMGELRLFYSLADVVFVGRSLVDLGPRQHGSDMIEPAALAKPVVVGPFTQNFADVMHHFHTAQAIRVVENAAALHDTIHSLLSGPADRAAMGRAAQEVVRQQLGATARHVQIILAELGANLRQS